MQVAPEARTQERAHLIDMLKLEDHHIVCDVPSWGGYLAQGIPNASRIVCLDPSSSLLRESPYQVHRCDLPYLPLASCSIDRVGSLVGLHHMVPKDGQRFVQEMVRILRPGGVIALAEVVDGSPVSRFLNGPVNMYARGGHRGVFLRPGQASLLLQEAHCTVSESVLPVEWVFSSKQQMVSFCKNLLGMVMATLEQVQTAIYSHFDVVEHDGSIHLPWSLVYASGIKSKEPL